MLLPVVPPNRTGAHAVQDKQQQQHTVEMMPGGATDPDAEEYRGGKDKQRGVGRGAATKNLLLASDSDAAAASLTCGGDHSWSNLSGEERGNVLLLIVLYFLRVRVCYSLPRVFVLVGAGGGDLRQPPCNSPHTTRYPTFFAFFFEVGSRLTQRARRRRTVRGLHDIFIFCTFLQLCRECRLA